MANNIDISALETALRTLLVCLPDDSLLDQTKTSSAALKRLRQDLAVAINRLISLSRNLDPIKRPGFVFDPTNPEIVGQLIGRTMMEQPRHLLAEIPRFYGSGVYALFYAGKYDAYQPISGKETPIYVGKADPPTPDAKTVEEQGPRLSSRLAEHAKSIKAASSTLNIGEFECRFLVVQSGWQRAAEDYLINLLKPIWNSRTCYGFGKHGDDPKTRANTRSPWDTLHPGRAWATREGNVVGLATIKQIKVQIAEHYAKHPPKR